MTKHDAAQLTGETEDAAAIRAVIHRETDAFRRGDLESWQNCFAADQRTTEIYGSPRSGLQHLGGWSNVHDHMQRVLKAGLACDMVEFHHVYRVLDIAGDMAWAVFESHSTNSRGEAQTALDTRVLRRIRGDWRIVYVAAYETTDTASTGAVVAVRADGAIRSMSPAALEVIERGTSFLAVHGRLRAARPDWTRKLTAAVTRAGDLVGFFEQRRYSETHGQGFRCPLVLGEDVDGETVACIVTARNGQVLVDIDPMGDLDRRLAGAQLVFDLSDAQTRVVGRIARGMGLTEIADDLGISVNTVRTHLSRIYGKVGVNSQTALVRQMLSLT